MQCKFLAYLSFFRPDRYLEYFKRTNSCCWDLYRSIKCQEMSILGSKEPTSDLRLYHRPQYRITPWNFLLTSYSNIYSCDWRSPTRRMNSCKHSPTRKICLQRYLDEVPISTVTRHLQYSETQNIVLCTVLSSDCVGDIFSKNIPLSSALISIVTVCSVALTWANSLKFFGHSVIDRLTLVHIFSSLIL